MRKINGIMAIVTLLASTSVFAAAGDAGCGLGSLIFTKNTKLSQSLASTTNATFYTQLFGITSGTSNCSAKGIVKNEAEANYYAEANLPSLKVDVARGSGESLMAFGQILGCSGDGLNKFSQAAQAKFTTLFPSDSVTALEFVSAANRELAPLCSNGA